MLELGDFSQRNDSMTINGVGQSVDQIDHAIFQSASIEAEEHVCNQRASIRTHGLATALAINP